MENLGSRIRRDLNDYQAEVSEKLQELQSQGLISQTELRKIIIDAQTTAKAVIDGLASQEQYGEEVIKIHAYGLFDRYKSKTESKIKAIEKQRKSSRISVKGRSIPIYFENEKGEPINPIKIEVEIVQNFLDCVLHVSIESVTIRTGNMLRDINLTAEEVPKILKINFNAKQLREETQKIQEIYRSFGASISQLTDSNYTEEVKNEYKLQLLEQMEQKISKHLKPQSQSFWQKLFRLGSR